MASPLMRNAASLHQQGRLVEAAQLYQQALRANPRDTDALYALGIIHLQSGRLEEAQSFLGETLRIRPQFPEALCSRGIALLQLRRREEALACLEQAIALMPDFVEAWSSRATALLGMNRHDEALEAFDRVLAIDPKHAISWNNRGNTFVAMRRLEEAVASFDKALALKPDLEIAQNNRMLALLELKKVTRIPAHAVRALFDDYSSYYDAAMLAALSYQAPQHLRALLERVSPGAAAPMRILDLGCGTGLCGEAFKDLAEGGRLDGIDLSAKMIDEARRRGIYTDFIVDDFESALSAFDGVYDLAIGGDALIYSGDLQPTLAGVARVLKPGGLFLFTLEKVASGDYEQTSANRFRHGEGYVRSAAARVGYEVLDIVECPLRSESREPVAGFAVAVRKPRVSASPSAA
jgi:predicted TPR repeat methyltransferase